MELFFFDIETCGSHSDYETFKLEDERGSKLFQSKFEKMSWIEKYKDISEAYIENAGIISTYGKICCISFGFIDNSGGYQIKSLYGEDEKQIVEDFNSLLKKIQTKNFKLSGFRVTHFDIPWLLHKLHKYDIVPAEIIFTYDKKPWEMRIVDMFEDWKGKFAWAFSFDELAYELGINSPKDTMNGSQVHEYYWKGKVEDVKTYCEKDVEVSIEVSKRIYKK
jgi:predicted PolB exonuclease-like 3'-5' exonuclease